METPDFLIAGAGIIGLNIGRELKKRFPQKKVIILEKESSCIAHASGRNSGVLHAGFYYTNDSLKAKFTRQGNRFLTRYCEENDLKIRKCGKLVTIRDESQLPMFDELVRRGEKNQIELEVISEKEARKIEPRAKTFRKALFSPTTSSVDPGEVLESMLKDCIDLGIEVRFQEGYESLSDSVITTRKEKYQTGYFINAAGLYADKIALQFGFSRDFRVLPFKGLYLYSRNSPGELKTHIYPVPDLKYPFLGVHFTITVDGKVKMGPTAIPAFWREQYKGLDNFNLREFGEIISRDLKLMLFSKFDFTRLAVTELKKYLKPVMVSQGAELITGIKRADYQKWGKPGIRAQLVDIRNMSLVNDFLLEGDAASLHVLNAVSPGFTCSRPFAGYVCDQIVQKLEQV